MDLESCKYGWSSQFYCDFSTGYSLWTSWSLECNESCRRGPCFSGHISPYYSSIISYTSLGVSSSWHLYGGWLIVSWVFNVPDVYVPHNLQVAVSLAACIYLLHDRLKSLGRAMVLGCVLFHRMFSFSICMCAFDASMHSCWIISNLETWSLYPI